IKITLKDPDKKKAHKAAQIIGQALVEKLGRKRVLGPEAPVIDKIRNHYLMEVFIKMERDKVNSNTVKKIIREEMNKLGSMKDFKNTLIIPDVDPY
ncbi:MAG TPA: primosomal protein N', partial [Cytophagaceae bacterium]